MDLAPAIDRFLTSSRDLFNSHFRIADPWADPHAAWDQRDLFEPVRNALFRALVSAPLDLQAADYGDPQPSIAVVGRHGSELPIMLNREIGVTSGYWDHPANRAHPSAELSFVSFFDWSDIERADYRYVMVKVVSWPGEPDLVGRHGLIETCHVTYRRADRVPPPPPER